MKLVYLGLLIFSSLLLSNCNNEASRVLQRTPTNTKNTFPPGSPAAPLNQIKCKISNDCPSSQACYQGVCNNWGTQCIGQHQCDSSVYACCEGGYCITDDAVCTTYYSYVTFQIISWIIFGFGIVNIVYWFLWYFVGRGKVARISSVGEAPIGKSVVQGVPITHNNLMTNNLGQNINGVEKNQKKVETKKEKINTSYQNIKNNPNVHFE